MDLDFLTEEVKKLARSLKPNSQTLRRSADRKIDHALRLIYFEGRICYGCNYLHYQHWKWRVPWNMQKTRMAL